MTGFGFDRMFNHTPSFEETNMTNTYLLHWSTNCWIIWYYDETGRKHYNGTYHGDLNQFLEDMSRHGPAGHSVIILPANS